MRLPDFVIIGAMKSGTTSLYRWLGDQPEIGFPELKEPDFFASEDRWAQGLEWYGRLFAGIPAEVLAGSVSVGCTDPRLAPTAAPRMAGILPAARLVYVLRHPEERLRSHYRHEVQRRRESRSLAEAVADPRSAYVARSLYFAGLAPFIDRFPSDQICVIRFEDLISDEHPAWNDILQHLGLPVRPMPGGIYNSIDEKAGFTRLLLWLWEHGWLRHAHRAPSGLRALGRSVLMRRGPSYRRQIAESRAPLPGEVSARIWADARQLQAWLGRSAPLWQPRPTDLAHL